MTTEYEEYLSKNQQAREAVAAANAQILAVSLANLAAAPILAKFCGTMLTELMANGFSREEALYIVKASAGSK